MKSRHSAGLNYRKSNPIRSHGFSTVRSAAFRRRAFSFKNAISMGFRFGELGGGYKKCRPRALDRVADPHRLICRQIIQDRVAARPKHRNQELPDTGEEDLAVHGTVQHHGSNDPVMAQSRDERRDVPVSVGHFTDRPLAGGAASAKPGHVRTDAGFVEKYQPLEVQTRLVIPPCDSTVSETAPVQ